MSCQKAAAKFRKEFAATDQKHSSLVKQLRENIADVESEGNYLSNYHLMAGPH